MTKPPELPAGVTRLRIVAILRGCPPRWAVAVAGAAIEAGLTVLEVTLDSDSALDQVSAIKNAYPEAEVGVGSVLRAEEVSPAVESGAEFVVSPVVDVETIELCAQLGIASIPGAATPTEIAHARRAGATAVKVFPIEQLGGPDYLRAVMSPLRSPALIPTGGVTSENLGDYLSAGAAAVGLGSAVFPRSALTTGDIESIGHLARSAVEALT